MDTSDHAGESPTRRQLLRDAYLCGRVLARDRELILTTDAYPERIARLVKALEDGDTAVAGAILRGWGIRR